MRKFLGLAGIVVGALAFVGIAGGITELGPEAGVNEFLNIFSTALVAGCLITLGTMMVKDEV
jgi:hypothetical protein